MFNSDANQDQFVNKILNGKLNGYFVDIGSGEPISHNNTYFFESFGWKGICIENNQEYAHDYAIRSCKFFNQNALTTDYKNILEKDKAPLLIDYLSVDIDELSTNAIKLLPHNQYKFRIITIEHDAYIHGNYYRQLQRDFLSELGYHLLASNVRIPDQCFRMLSGLNHLDNNGFEDWWVHPSLGKNHYSFDGLLPEDLLAQLS